MVVSNTLFYVIGVSSFVGGVVTAALVFCCYMRYRKTSITSKVPPLMIKHDSQSSIHVKESTKIDVSPHTSNKHLSDAKNATIVKSK